MTTGTGTGRDDLAQWAADHYGCEVPTLREGDEIEIPEHPFDRCIVERFKAGGMLVEVTRLCTGEPWSLPREYVPMKGDPVFLSKIGRPHYGTTQAIGLWWRVALVALVLLFMPGQAIERARAAGEVANLEDQRHWERLIRKAKVFAAGTMVPKEMQGKPDVVLAGMATCLRAGFSEDAVSSLHVIEGKLDLNAQMYLGAAHIAGFETRVVRTDNEACVLKIRRPGDEEWLEVAFTIDDARRAGFLDEWVEHWVTYVKADKSRGNRLEKFVIGREGVTTPEWALDEIAAGKVKRMDNWAKYPADMLFTKAAKRAVRRFCPEVLYGVAEDVRRATTAVTIDIDDDDEPVDAEIAPAHGAGAETGAEPATPDIEDAGPAPATQLNRVLLRDLIDMLDDGQRDRLRVLAKENEIPNLASGHFTEASAQLLANLIHQVRTTPAEPADEDDPERPFD